MHISPYSILPFFSSISILSLGILVFLKNRSTRLNKLFLYFCGSLFLWPFCYSITYSIKSYDLALILSKTACFTVIISSALFYEIILIFLDIKNKEIFFVRLFYPIYFISLPVLYLSDNLLSGVHTYYFGYYSKAGPFYFIPMLLSYFFMGRPAYLLLKYIQSKKLDQKKNAQAKYFLAGSFFIIAASVDYIPKYNIEFYPIGSLLALFWVATMTYAILKHQLMNINIALKKSLVYSILITLISIVFLTLVLLLERVFQGILGYDTRIGSVIAALIIASIFAPLRNYIQHFVDKRLFKATTSELADQVEHYKKEVAQSDKLKAISTLASGMAHEVKNPLTAIKTFAEYLPEKWEDLEFRNKFSKIVGNEVDRIDNIVHQLLDFAKPSPLQLKETDISQLISDTLSFLNSEFIKNNITVETNLEQGIKDYRINGSEKTGLNPLILKSSNPELNQSSNPDSANPLILKSSNPELNQSSNPDSTNPSILQSSNPIFINADPARLKQAFLNLFLNAIDAMPEGGILAVRCTVNSSRGTSHTVNHTPHTVITIKDTGLGIKKEDLQHIFDPFFSKKDNGTGLGLSITSQIIQEHGGKIEVESEVDKGTAFVIELPENRD